MKLSYYILISYLIVYETNGKILTCKESVDSNVCYDVEKIQDYVNSINPKPWPTYIDIGLKVWDIIDVDENQQTVTLSMKAHFKWKDIRLDVNRSKEDKEKYVIHQLMYLITYSYLYSYFILFFSNQNWFLIKNENMVDIWYPKIYIANSVTIQSLISHTDATSLNDLWYNYPSHTLKYNVIFVAIVSCKLDFQSFPFDNHECDLILRNWSGGSYRIVLKSPTIYGHDENGKENGGKYFNITTTGNHKLDYKFQFESLPTAEYQDNGYKYSETRIKMIFERTEKSRIKIIGGYHATTAIFAILSLLSFFIQPDVVPGRMGMLIILYLIQINMYR